jgi:predicted ABC-type transport system involved in lysophospholipase L1 biosynthesis ATPase subunit
MLILQTRALPPAALPLLRRAASEGAPAALAMEALPVAGGLFSLRLAAGDMALLEGGRPSERRQVLAIAAGLGFRGPGRCRLKGLNTRELAGDVRRTLRQRHVGRVLAIDNLPVGLSVRGAVAVPLLAQGLAPHTAFERATRMLDALGPSTLAGQRCENLDARERQLALLARALVGSPTLLVLEDLGAGLAAADLPAVRAALRVATAVEGCSVLMTSPEPRLAGMADQRISLDAVTV